MRIDPSLAATVAAVVDEGTLDAAARTLRVTPSAVSQRVKSLEEQLGRVLVVRSRPARATPAGQSVIRLARQQALLEHDALVDLGLDAEDGATRTTTMPLAVNADSLSSWFLAPLARLSAQHPVVFDLHRDDQGFTARLLESGTVMAAVTAQAEAVPGCVSTRLGSLRYDAIASPGFVRRWFASGVTTDALGSAPFVDFDRRDDLQQDWLRAQGVDPRDVPRHYVPSSSDFAEAVLLGLGWGVLPAQQTAAALRDGRGVAIGGESIMVDLYWQQWNLRSPLLDAVAAEVAAAASVALELA